MWRCRGENIPLFDTHALKTNSKIQRIKLYNSSPFVLSTSISFGHRELYLFSTLLSTSWSCSQQRCHYSYNFVNFTRVEWDSPAGPSNAGPLQRGIFSATSSTPATDRIPTVQPILWGRTGRPVTKFNVNFVGIKLNSDLASQHFKCLSRTGREIALQIQRNWSTYLVGI